MADEWRRVKFSELCDITRGGSPRPIHEWIAPTGIPWVKIADASCANSRFIERTAEFIYPEGRSKSRSVVPGDLILSNSASPGMPMFMAIDACIHDGWLLLRGFKGIDKLFCYYLLLFEKDRIVRQGTGTVFTNLKTEILKNHEVTIPSLEQQEAIAHILGTLDDKIELNRKRNETLEAIAHTIFNSWFVDFDPVRAKMDGRQPVGMDAETAALFPDSFEDLSIGKVPKGWVVSKLSELCSTQYGYTASANEQAIGPKFLRVKDINKLDWVEWDCVPFCEISTKNREKYGLKIGDIVVARMADPGKAAIVDDDIDAVFASYLVRLKTNSMAYAYFLYYFLTSPLFRDYSAGVMGGSVQANMNARVIVDVSMAIPPDVLIEAFSRLVIPMRQRIAHNASENSLLCTIRDTLLPKLISGEIRVKDVEKSVEEHAG